MEHRLIYLLWAGLPAGCGLWTVDRGLWDIPPHQPSWYFTLTQDHAKNGRITRSIQPYAGCTPYAIKNTSSHQNGYRRINKEVSTES